MRESTELAELARPAFERWQELLRSDPELSEPEEGESAATSSPSASATSEAPATRHKTRARRAQELHDQCSRLMHLLSHIWHSVSQFLADFPGTPHPPRNLYVLSQLPIGTVFMQPVSVRIYSFVHILLMYNTFTRIRVCDNYSVYTRIYTVYTRVVQQITGIYV